MALRVVALATLLSIGAACRKCPPGPPAAGVVLRDAKTKSPICDAQVVLVDGAYSETAKSSPLANGCIFSAVTARPGSYRVSVTAAGYQPTESAISVTRADDSCRLLGSTVTLELSR